MSPRQHSRSIKNNTLAVLGAVAVLTGAGAGIYYGTQNGGGGQPNTANIFVDTNGGACTRSASLVSYNDSTACGSLDAANDICQGGDIVMIENGTYASQTITGSGVSRGIGSVCTFEPDAGAVATFNCLNAQDIDGNTVYGGGECINDNPGASYITFDGAPNQSCLSTSCMRLRETYYTNEFYTQTQGRNSVDGDYVTYNHFDGGMLTFGGGHDTVMHSDLGPNRDPGNIQCCRGNNVTFSDNFIHDSGIGENSTGHSECATFWEGTNINWARNYFKNCMEYSISGDTDNNAIGGTVNGNVFWDPEYTYRNGNVKQLYFPADGPPDCNVTVSNNWFQTNSFDDGCNGVIDGGGNTYHDISVEPPDPRQDG